MERAPSSSVPVGEGSAESQGAGRLETFCSQALAPSMDWLEFLSFLLSPLELGDSEPVVVYGTDYLQQVSELINRTEPRLRGAHSVWGGVQGSVQAILLGLGFRGPTVVSVPIPCSTPTFTGRCVVPGSERGILGERP